MQPMTMFRTHHAHCVHGPQTRCIPATTERLKGLPKVINSAVTYRTSSTDQKYPGNTNSSSSTQLGFVVNILNIRSSAVSFGGDNVHVYRGGRTRANEARRY